MYLIGKNVNDLTDLDIKRLVDNAIPESKSLDYKRELTLLDSKDKRELVNDITSFYNTDGGCLIYGIEEQKDDKGQNTGVPSIVYGIEGDNIDKLIQQIEDIVKSNTDPQITNLALKLISVEAKKVLVIGVAKQIGLPSMVTFNESNKFYKRKNSGKYSVDVYELYTMFLQNQLIKEKAEAFRDKRISEISQFRVFPNLDIRASYFIHIIPLNFLNEKIIDISNVENDDIQLLMRPLSFTNGWDKMYNLDGYSTFSHSNSARQKIGAYDQFFRNGVYEIYTADIFNFNQTSDELITEIDSNELIEKTLEKLQNCFKVLKKYNVEAPLIIYFSFLNVKKGILTGKFHYNFGRRFETNDILLPSILANTYEVDLKKLIKPSFDILWQALGFRGSPL